MATSQKDFQKQNGQLSDFYSYALTLPQWIKHIR